MDSTKVSPLKLTTKMEASPGLLLSQPAPPPISSFSDAETLTAVGAKELTDAKVLTPKNPQADSKHTHVEIPDIGKEKNLQPASKSVAPNGSESNHLQVALEPIGTKIPTAVEGRNPQPTTESTPAPRVNAPMTARSHLTNPPPKMETEQSGSFQLPRMKFWGRRHQSRKRSIAGQSICVKAPQTRIKRAKAAGVEYLTMKLSDNTNVSH